MVFKMYEFGLVKVCHAVSISCALFANDLDMLNLGIS